MKLVAETRPSRRRSATTSATHYLNNERAITSRCTWLVPS